MTTIAYKDGVIAYDSRICNQRVDASQPLVFSRNL